ncbi:hypothetical protein ACFQ1I_42645 [Kitasatospora arboriphila]
MDLAESSAPRILLLTEGGTETLGVAVLLTAAAVCAAAAVRSGRSAASRTVSALAAAAVLTALVLLGLDEGLRLLVRAVPLVLAAAAVGWAVRLARTGE